MGNLVPRLPPCKLGVRPSLKGKALGTRLRRRGGGGGGRVSWEILPRKINKTGVEAVYFVRFYLYNKLRRKTLL